ncbi:MAG TPA: response regulator [Anaerolineae bacterium]|nr:response regulator [Anaerolineae bacterium]HMR62556.1 response regulator [Anaerolineae bacterium]
MDGPLILVAEDERDIRDLIVITLELDGFNVVPVTNGQEAVTKAKEINPDLILMDVRMPKMSGYEACKQLKADEDTQRIPVVFLSAKGQEAEVNTGLEVGAAEYLLKPFAPDELARRVNQILVKHGRL